MPSLADPTRVGVQLQVSRAIKALRWSALAKGPQKEKKLRVLPRNVLGVLGTGSDFIQDALGAFRAPTYSKHQTLNLSK